MKKKKNLPAVHEQGTVVVQEPKEKKKKEGAIKSPMTVTKELKEMGESYSKYAMFLWYICIMAVAVVMGILFKLPIAMTAVCCFFYILMTPKLLYNYKKQRYEKKRFDDLDSYMTQMNQSFTSTHNVLVSLKQTESTFTKGKMKNVLRKAIMHIESATTSVRRAEEEALHMIAKEYDCEKIRNLHDFLIRAEVRGGDCTDEFKVLDKINNVWKVAVLDYYKKVMSGRMVITIYFVLLLAVCIFLLRKFPEMIPLIDNRVVQFTNMFEIICFILVFTFTDSKLNSSLLRDAQFMSEAAADSANAYLATFDSKKERKKYLPLIIFSFFICGALLALKPTGMTAIVCVGFVVLVFNMHKLIYYLTWLSVQSEMKKAFPKWLFDVLLLMQSDSVEASIFRSREYAPPILRQELERICRELDRSPGNPDAYMSFLAEFNLEGVENAMRSLYSLAVGTGNREVMTTVIDHSMTLLQEAEKESIKTKGDLKSAYQHIPTALMTLAMLAYMGALIMEVFAKLGTVMNL